MADGARKGGIRTPQALTDWCVRATPAVESVHVDADHARSKPAAGTITLVAGAGVLGDAHFGATVQHRSRVAIDATQPNLRQVHLIPAELHDELRTRGFAIAPGAMGENITTRGVDLLGLPTGTSLRLGDDALVALTGLRNPCAQLDELEPGLLRAVSRDGDGRLVRRAGVMAVVIEGGVVRPGDRIALALPPPPHHALARV